MADNTMTTGAAQGDAAAAGGNGTDQTGAAGTGGNSGQTTAPDGQGQQGAVLGSTAFADADKAGAGQNQQGKPEGESGQNGKTDEETKPEAAVPETADAYTFEAPEGVKVNDGMLAQVKGIALAGKLSQDQFAAIMPELVRIDAERFGAINTAYAKQRADGVAALRQEWGTDFDGNVSLAQKAVKTFGSPELGALFDATGIGDHPLIVRTFATIGKALSEDMIVGRQLDHGGKDRSAADILYGK